MFSSSINFSYTHQNADQVWAVVGFGLTGESDEKVIDSTVFVVPLCVWEVMVLGIWYPPGGKVLEPPRNGAVLKTVCTVRLGRVG